MLGVRSVAAEGITGMSRRIQRQRTKGWRMPEGAVYVGRPSRWGNPYRREDYDGYYDEAAIPALMVSDFRGGCINRTFIAELPEYPSIDTIRKALRGRDLACWCPLDQPCHADVLLELVA